MQKILNNILRHLKQHNIFFGLMIVWCIFLHCSMSHDKVNSILYESKTMHEVSMNFKSVAEVFDAINQVSSRLQITELLAHLFKKATPTEARILSNISLGMLRPPYEGTQFNIAQKSMIKIIASLTHHTVATIEHEAKKLGDLGLVVSALYKDQSEQSMTVLQVFKKLEELEAISGTGSQEERLQLIVALLNDLDPLSAHYVVSIILGTLRLGFSDMTIIDALSWMEVGDKSIRSELETAYNICADIGLIAQTLKEGGLKAIKHMKTTVGIPIRLAAAERLPNAEAVFEKVGKCIAQPKLDGFRLQVHLDKTHSKKPIIKFFSRNLIDMSPMFPDLVKAFEELDVETLIVEGEAIAYEPETGSFVPFQETVKRKRKHNIEQAAQDLPLQLFLFDILYLNGHELINEPHNVRRDKLAHVLKKNADPALKIIPEVEIKSAKSLEHYFYENVSAGLEGVMIKKDDAVYQAGKRNFNWIKLKRITQSHLEDTIDTVILGYYPGAGKRVHFGIGAFLVGVYNKSTDSYQTVAKVGTGLKDDEWKELRAKCDKLHVAKKPINVDCAKELYPDVWVNPELVCVVRADEITLSPLHTAGKTEEKLGFALRFPRFMGYRPDKKPEQTTSPKELSHLYKDQYEKKEK